MENFKFILVSLIVLAIVGLLGYWAFITIEPGDVHVAKEQEQALEEQNKELTAQIDDLKTQVATLQAAQATQTPPPATTPTQTATPPTSTTASKYQSLINSLQQLITDKVYMKVGSQGTRVGTVETFLNAYNKTTKKIDNDYGASTKAAVAAFQKAQGLSSDGQTGPTTYQKMIDWLKKQ